MNDRLIQLRNSLAHLLEGICNLTLGYAKPLGQFHRRGQAGIYDLPECALKLPWQKAVFDHEGFIVHPRADISEKFLGVYSDTAPGFLCILLCNNVQCGGLVQVELLAGKAVFLLQGLITYSSPDIGHELASSRICLTGFHFS